MSERTFVVEETPPDLSIPEDKIIRAVVDEVKFEHVEYQKNGEAKSFDQLIWWWAVKDGEYAGRKVRGKTGVKLFPSPDNRFYVWATALLQRELGQNSGLSLDDLVGLPADITVSHKPNPKDPKRHFEEVDEVLPIGGGLDFTSEPPF